MELRGDEGLSTIRRPIRHPLTSRRSSRYGRGARTAESPPHCILAHLIAFDRMRDADPDLSSADPLILVCLDDQPATVLGHFLKDKALVVGGLVVPADAQVDRCANAIGCSFLSPAITMNLRRNDITYSEIVELSVWEWALCARRFVGEGTAVRISLHL
jgi:hypothetical protein